MRYLIYRPKQIPIATDNYDYDSHWLDGKGMVVFDMVCFDYTDDGKTWYDINKDQPGFKEEKWPKDI